MPIRQTRTNGLVFRPFTSGELAELAEVLDNQTNDVMGRLSFSVLNVVFKYTRDKTIYQLNNFAWKSIISFLSYSSVITCKIELSQPS